MLPADWLISVSHDTFAFQLPWWKMTVCHRLYYHYWLVAVLGSSLRLCWASGSGQAQRFTSQAQHWAFFLDLPTNCFGWAGQHLPVQLLVDTMRESQWAHAHQRSADPDINAGVELQGSLLTCASSQMLHGSTSPYCWRKLLPRLTSSSYTSKMDTEICALPVINCSCHGFGRINKEIIIIIVYSGDFSRVHQRECTPWNLETMHFVIW